MPLASSRKPNNRIQRLLDATEKGPLNQWSDRLGGYARHIGVKLSDINWNSTPGEIAEKICEKIEAGEASGFVLDDLLKATGH